MPTKEQFERYKEVQHSGIYNMLTQWVLAAHDARLDEETYWKIITNYKELSEQYGA